MEKLKKMTNAERTLLSKTRIVEAANLWFAKNGYYGAKMSDIAEAAGLTLPGLLHHYANKEELLVAVLESRDQQNQEFFEQLFQQSNEKNILDTLTKLVQYNQNNPELVKMFTLLASESIDADHPGHEYFLQRYRYFRLQYLALLKDAQTKGKIKPDINVELLGTMVMAMMDGLQLQWLLDPEHVDMTKTFEEFSKIFMQGLGEHSTGRL